MNELTDIANKCNSDRGTIEGAQHNYTEVYYDLFLHSRQEVLEFFEIGIERGKGMRMWNEFFPNTNFYAIDIKDVSISLPRLKCFRSNQENRVDLQNTMDQIGKQFDIIIDDGGHHMSHQQVSLGFLFPFLKPGGLYFIEDLHTSNFEPGEECYGPMDIDEDRSNTTLNVIKNFMSKKIFDSKYALPVELEYLNSHIKSCEFFSNEKLCLIRKK